MLEITYIKNNLDVFTPIKLAKFRLADCISVPLLFTTALNSPAEFNLKKQPSVGAATPVAITGGATYFPTGSTSVVGYADQARGNVAPYSRGSSTVAPVDSYLHILGKMSPGIGGNGGGSGTTGATKGGNGYRGSGGGGGGSTLNTFTSGGGGVGGNGYVCIVAIA